MTITPEEAREMGEIVERLENAWGPRKMTAQELNVEIAHLLGYSNIGATYPRREPGRGETDTPATHPVTKDDCYLPDWCGDGEKVEVAKGATEEGEASQP